MVAIGDVINLIATDSGKDASQVTETPLSRPQMKLLSRGAQSALELPLKDSLATRSVAFCFPDSPLVYPTSENELDAHLSGATLVVQNLQASVPVFRRICDTVALRRRRLVTCSLYVSSPGALAFGMHVDKWDVYTVQLLGHKRFWFEESKSKVVESTTGTCLFIPKDVPHRADTITRSAHLSFGIR